MNLIAMGQDRFRIVALVRDQPYQVARVEPVVDEEPKGDLNGLASGVRASLDDYLHDLFTLLEQPQEAIQIPAEPTQLSLVAAAALQIPMAERQLLLQMTDVAVRLRQEEAWLAREREKQQSLLRLRKHLGSVTPLDSRSRLSRLSPN